MAGLEGLASPQIQALRGRGLLIGIELGTGHGTARDLALRLLERGVLAKDTHAQVLRLAPPLVIDEPTIDWLIEQVGAALS